MDLPVACVTMVDAREGDAYVVDLRVSNNHASSKSWNRYIVDTGYPIDIFSFFDKSTETYSRGGGPRASLIRALFEEDPTADTYTRIQNLIQPWVDDKTPRICGMIITHTDRDHWGNAEWLTRCLQWGHQDRKNTFSMNPLPTYTSPMIEWLKDVAAMSKGRMEDLTKKTAEDMAIKQGNLREKARKWLLDEYGIEWQKTAQAVKLGNHREIVEEERVLDRQLFQNRTQWETAFKKYQDIQLALLKEKPYCSLEVLGYRNLSKDILKKVKERGQKLTPEELKKLQNYPNAWTTEYLVRWKHKEFTPTVGCSFKDIPDMAKALGYHVSYRFNLQKISNNLNEADVAEPDMAMLMSPLTNAWISANTTTSVKTWSDRPIFKPSRDQLIAAGAAGGDMISETLDHEVLVIAEVCLEPPPSSAKRSYPVGRNDANSVLAGDWLRLMGRHRFVVEGVDKLEIDEDALKIEAELDRYKIMGLELKLIEDDIERKRLEENSEKLMAKFLELVMDGWFAEEPAQPDKLVLDVDCLGLQDTVYGLNFVLTPEKNQSGERIYSYWKSTYSGCAGTRFSRDFLHLAAQAYLSPHHTEKWIIKARSNSEVLEEELANDDYLYAVELNGLIENVLKRKGTNQNHKTFVPQGTRDDLKKLFDDAKPGIKKIEDEYKAKRKALEAKAAATMTSKKVTKKNRSWGHAANRASLITHFRFEALTRGGYGPQVDFDMLFTGDAFEIGAGESQPYAPHLRPGHNDFQIPSAVRPRTIEKQPGLFSNPDGNLLSWLWQNGNLRSMRVGVLKLPHHGSSNTTNALFYRLVSASIYLISGANVPHGHPRPETLQSIINTIMEEDGPARPPSDFCSAEAMERATDPDAANEVMNLTDISNRPRPRMIFLTSYTCRDKQWTWAEREAEMKSIIEKRAAARQAMNQKPKPPGPNPDPNTMPIENDESESSSDDDLHHEPHEDEGDVPGKKTRKKDYIDVKQFVHFHSHHLGGFNDVSEADYEKWRQHSRMKRGLEPLGEVPEYKMPPRANVRLFVQKAAGAATRLMFGFDSSLPYQHRVEWNPADWDEIRADDHNYGGGYDAFHDPVAYPSWKEKPKWEIGLSQHKFNPGNRPPVNKFGTLVPTDTPPVMPPGHALPKRWADGIIESTNPAEDLAQDDEFMTMNRGFRADGALNVEEEGDDNPFTKPGIDEEDEYM